MKNIILALLCSTGIAAPSEKPQLWSQKMQKLGTTLSELMPELVSTKPPSPVALKKLKDGAKTMTQLAHQIKMGASGSAPTPPDADPSLALLSTSFEREAKHASAALQSGNIGYAKSTLRLMTTYCVSCHTRTDQGPQFPTMPLNAKSGSLSKVEKAQLMVATRQFDGALKEFESVISDPQFAKTRQIEWGRAVRNAFMISVRVKQDPDRALKTISSIEALSTTPPLFREFVSKWKQSLIAWKNEGKKTFDSEEALFAEATRLSKEAEAMKKYPMDHSSDILNLRLSLAAHELLSKYPNGKHVSDGLLQLGSAYDLLDDHMISPMPEMYFEACIRKTPHSPVAERCYHRYEANVYFGYTGSAGTSIPEDISQLMSELRTLAKTKS